MCRILTEIPCPEPEKPAIMGIRENVYFFLQYVSISVQNGGRQASDFMVKC